MALPADKQRKDVSLEGKIKGFDLDHAEADEALDARQFHYGSLCSQYGGLDNATIARIEDAAMCCHLRDFQAALHIFDALPPELSHHPVVVYEHSQVHWLDWSLYKCEKVLEEGIAWAKENTPNSGRPGVYTLLRIVLGRTKVYTDGNFREARDAMREVKAWLSETPIEEYTDVQVSRVQFLSRKEDLGLTSLIKVPLRLQLLSPPPLLEQLGEQFRCRVFQGDPRRYRAERNAKAESPP